MTEENPKPEAPKPEALKTRTSKAVAMMTAGSLIGRVVLFASNWILGALLDEETFGVSGLVGMVAIFAWTFVGFGLDDVLVQRRRGLTGWQATAFRSSVIGALIVGAATALLAPVLGHVFSEPRMVGPVLVVALTFPIASLSIVTGANLSSRMDFKFILGWGLIETMALQALTLVFAALGFGAYSFALPGPIVLGARAIAYYMRAPKMRTRMQSGIRMLKLLRRGAAVAGAKFVNCLIGQGDYIVLGLLATTSEIGFYYFAFRLAAAPVRTISVSLNSVLFPAMTQLKADPLRQSASAVKSALLLSWLAAPVGYFQIAVAAPLLNMFFGDKWDASIPVIQLLSLGLVIEGILAITRAYLGAAGRFNTVFAYSLINAIGYMAACVIGTLAGSIIGLALAVSLFYLITQPLMFMLLVDKSEHRLRNAFGIFIQPTLVAALAFGAAWAFSVSGLVPRDPIVAIVLITAIGWPLFALLYWLTARSAFGQLIDIVKSAASRRAA